MSAPADWGTGPRSDRTRLAIIAVSVAVSLVAIAAILVLLPGGNESSSAAPAQAPSAAPPKNLTTSATDTRADDSPPTSTPTGWTWETATWPNAPGSAPVALPLHPLYGPREITGDHRAGWDHSALGALGAASQLLYRASMQVDEAQSHASEGPGKAELLANAAQTVTPVTDRFAVYKGFRFVSYNRDLASIQLRTALGPKNKDMLCTLNLSWVNGDWRAQADSATGLCLAMTPLDPAATGFIEWGPAS